MRRKRPTFEHAKRVYVHRFTCEHIPAWARKPRPDGWYYAPQYATDQEWYEKTAFPGEPDHIGRITGCYSRNASWPCGQTCGRPFNPHDECWNDRPWAQSARLASG